MDAYEPIARYYDLTHDQLAEDIPFLLQQAAEAGGPVLELGCGSGRLLIPLARAGFAVTGVDLSPEMLARAELRLAAEPADVRARAQLLAADVTTLRLLAEERFGLIFFGYNTFMHLDEAGAGATLKRLRSRLRPGGRLLIDVTNPMLLAAAADDPELVLEDTLTDPSTGEIIRQYTAYEAVPGEQAVEVTWVYERADSSTAGAQVGTTARMRYHYLYPHQYDLLLTLTGFRLQALYGDYDGAPFSEEAQRLLLVAGGDSRSVDQYSVDQ